MMPRVRRAITPALAFSVTPSFQAMLPTCASTLDMRRYALAVHGVELEERLDDSLPAIWADPFQLQQVFLNLIGNAEQALRGWLLDRLEDRRYWFDAQGRPHLSETRY